MTHEELLEQLEAANSTASMGNLDEAERISYTILAALEPLDEAEVAVHWKIKLGAIVQLSNILRRRGETQAALARAFEALPIAIEAGDTISEGKVYTTIGNIYRFMNDHEHGLEYLQKALLLFEESGKREYFGGVLGNIGDVYSMLTDYPRAIEYMGRALSVMSESPSSRQSSAVVLGNLGSVYSKMTNYSQALEYLMQALVIHEEFNAKEEQGDVLGNIGIVYYYLRDYQHGLEYMLRGVQLHEQIGARAKCASKYGNIGNIYCSLNDYPKALEYMNRSLDILQELGGRSNLANVLYSIGYVYMLLEDFNTALEYLHKSLDKYQELNIHISVVHKQCIIGTIYANPAFAGYDPRKAEEILVETLSELEILGVLGHNLTELLKLAELYERTLQWEKANHWNKKHAALVKEVFTEEVKKQADKFAYDRKIAEEQAQREATETLLYNILPKSIADRMMEKKSTISDYFENVSIFFSDIVNFTTISAKISPQELVEGLNAVFSEFDRIAKRHGIEKIKTIGDSYMAVCGIPEPCENHAERLALFALEVSEAIKKFSFSDAKISVVNRIGLHSGSVVAGVIGENKFLYDLWGDAVNTASRMESHGEAGKIHVSEEFRNAVGESSFTFIERGELDIKGKGKMKTYFLENEKDKQ